MIGTNAQFVRRCPGCTAISAPSFTLTSEQRRAAVPAPCPWPWLGALVVRHRLLTLLSTSALFPPDYGSSADFDTAQRVSFTVGSSGIQGDAWWAAFSLPWPGGAKALFVYAGGAYSGGPATSPSGMSKHSTYPRPACITSGGQLSFAYC